MKYHDQKKLGRNEFMAYTSTLLFITKISKNTKSSRAGTWRQDLIQRPWRSADYCLALHGLLSLLSYRTQNHQPSDVTTHNGLGPALNNH